MLYAVYVCVQAGLLRHSLSVHQVDEEPRYLCVSEPEYRMIVAFFFHSVFFLSGVIQYSTITESVFFILNSPFSYPRGLFFVSYVLDVYYMQTNNKKKNWNFFPIARNIFSAAIIDHLIILSGNLCMDALCGVW